MNANYSQQINNNILQVPNSSQRGRLNSSRGQAGRGVPNGGVMFYTESGTPLYVSGLGSENIIYTISKDDISPTCRKSVTCGNNQSI